MRAVGFYEFGGPEVLQVVELPDPVPGPRQVRIRAAACDIKVSETFVHTGDITDWLGPERPVVCGWDVAGVIDEVGRDARNVFKPGDPVVAMVFGYTGKGAQSEYVIADVASTVDAPKGKTFLEAGSFLTNAMTARIMLDTSQILPSETVAVTGGAGAVGAFAIQLAKAEGYRVVADAKDSDRAFVEGLGADVVVSRSDDFAAAVIAEVGRVNALVDAANIGGSVADVVSDGGVAVSARWQSGAFERGVQWKPMFSADRITDTAELRKLSQQVETGVLTPRVADVYLPEQAAEAYRRLQSERGLRGRLVFAF